MRGNKVVAVIMICIILIISFPTNIRSVGTMDWHYNSNGCFNIWGEGVQTTFADHGYETYFKVNSSETHVSRGSASLSNVTLQMNFSYVSDNNFVKIQYKIKNNNSTQVTVGVASCADIQIGSNDYAPIKNLAGNRGFTMEGDGHTFKFLARDTYGVVNVDTYWFGQYQVNYERRWSNSTYFDYAGISSRQGDSGMAFSWQNRPVGPGQELDLSVLIGIGDVNNPPTITAGELDKEQYIPEEHIHIEGTVNDPDMNDIVGIRYSIDNGIEYTAKEGIEPHKTDVPYSIDCIVPADITEGMHNLQIWAYDNHGNISQVVVRPFKAILDIAPPEATHTINPENWTREDVTITITATDDRSGVKSITSPDGTVTNSDTVSYTVGKNGTYDFKLEDNAGNSAVYQVEIDNIDKVKPDIGLTNPSKKWTKDDIEVDFSASDDLSGVEKVVLPSKQEVKLENSKYFIQTNGTYKFTVYDRAGNYKIQKITVQNIDKENPTLNLKARQDWVADKVDITWTSEDLKSGIANIKLPNGKYNSNSTGTYTVYDNGTYEFTVYDNVGNETTQTIEIQNIDKINPNLQLQYDQNWELEELNITWQISDSESGIREIWLPDGSISKNLTGSFRVVKNGIYKFVVYDNVGNSTVKEVNITNIDNDGPKIILSMNPDWTAGKVRITYEVIDAESGLRELILPNTKTSKEIKGEYYALENRNIFIYSI